MGEILTRLRDLLSVDEDLTTFCQDTFGRGHMVFLGMNLLTSVDQVEMPAVVIDSIEIKRAGPKQIAKVVIGTLIKEDETDTVGNKTTFKGFLGSESFIGEVIEAVYRGQRSLQAKISVEEAGTFTNTVFPVFSSKANFFVEYSLPAFRR